MQSFLKTAEIIVGNNQENAAYPSGLCAERTAIYWLAANHPGQEIKKNICSWRPKNEAADNNIPIPPCGSCRQSILEYESKQSSLLKFILRLHKEKQLNATV